MLNIRSKRDLECAYFMVKTYTQMLSDHPELLEEQRTKALEKVADWKREIREYTHRTVDDHIMVKEYGMDGYIERHPLPENLTTEEDAEEYFDEYERIYSRPSAYDCTGQAFTSWHKIYRAKDGRFWVYHSIGFDV